MLPESREECTVLPIEVPPVDIYRLLSQLRFNPSTFKEQQDVLGVSGTYITAVLHMYAELGGAEDILQRIIDANIECSNDQKSRENLRALLTSQLIPWPLYELVAEEARLSLERANKPLGSTDRTYSPFMWGVGGIISEPTLVAATAVLPLETIIDSINKYNRAMNRVTTIELTEQPVSVEGGKIISVKLHRTQTPESIQKLDELLGMQTQATDAERKAVIDAICYRDLATTLGAFVGVTLLGGRPAQHIVIEGNPAGQTDIQVYYSGSGNNLFHRIGQVVLDAVGLYIHKTFGYAHKAWERIISRNIEHATFALDKVQLQKTIKENERLAREKARLEFLQQVTETNRKYAMARGLIHDIKNHALGLYAKAFVYACDMYHLVTGQELPKQEDKPLKDLVSEILQQDGLPPLLSLGFRYVQETVKTAEEILAAASSGMHVEINPTKTKANYLGLLQEAISLIRPIYQGKVEITVECSEDIFVNVDTQYFGAALKNLIDNAASASVEEGRVGSVHIEIEEIKKRRGTYVLSTITQSGCMTPDIEEKLNNGESFTTKPTGNGIGASTSYDIIKNMHGGHIKYSAQDKGAIITVQL